MYSAKHLSAKCLSQNVQVPIPRYFVLDKPRSALEQFKEALEALGILDVVKKFPKEFEQLFCFQATKLTCFMLQTQLSTTYNPSGSNCRAKEELIDCEGTL